jgi:diguanylate cyclase (GGDEF)-like protein
MLKQIKRLSLTSRGLKYKLRIALYLMSIIPLLVCLYLVSNYILPNYILPKGGLPVDIIIALGISALIAFFGGLLIKEVFDRVLSVTSAAKMIAGGDANRALEVKYADEVGDLSSALNQLTQRIRGNMNELKSYGEKTTQINMEIQRRVMMLSGLLEISSLISQNAKLEDILKVTTEKSRLLANTDTAYLLFREEGQDNFYVRSADGLNAQALLNQQVKSGQSLFNEAIKLKRPLVLDKQHAWDEKLSRTFNEEFQLKNTLAIPVYLRGKAIAILGVGNTKESFLFRREDIELLDIFAKQISIAVESDFLTRRIEKLEIKDTLTGLYNESFIRNRLHEEIKRAITYRRPCAFVLIDVDNFKKFDDNFGSVQAELALKRIATLLKDSVTEIDRVGRFGDDQFAIILPERNKRRAQEVAEDIRRKIEFSFSEEKDVNKRITVSGGISENPLDGIEAEELIIVAETMLRLAKQQGKNRVMGFKEQSTCQ